MSAELFTISDTMRTAAKSVAVSHEHYVENCRVLSSLKGKPDAMRVALEERKKAHVAYHMALGFLKAATLKANPELNAMAEEERQPLASSLDKLLNKLIASNQCEDDHVIFMPQQELVWD